MDENIIALLLACLHQDASRISSDRLTALTLTEWQALLLLAREQQVSALLAHRLKTRGLEVAAPPEIRRELQATYRRNAFRNLRLYSELNHIVTALHAADISVIALKGVYMASAVYENLALREVGDIDLLAPIGDLERATEILEAQGYTPTAPISVPAAMTTLHHLPVFVKPPAANVELHWNITPPNTNYSVAPAGLWERALPARIAGSDVLGLCPEDLLLHLCVHTSYQHLFEFGLRPSCDIAEVIRHFGAALNWLQVVERARRWRWQDGVYGALLLAKDLLGAAVPDAVLRDLRPARFDESLVAIARMQVFTDRHMTDALSINLVQMWQGAGLLGKIRVFWRSLFLPKAQISLVYAVPLDSPRIYLCYIIRLQKILSRYLTLALGLRRGDPMLTAVAQRKADLLDWFGS